MGSIPALSAMSDFNGEPDELAGRLLRYVEKLRERIAKSTAQFPDFEGGYVSAQEDVLDDLEKLLNPPPPDPEGRPAHWTPPQT